MFGLFNYIKGFLSLCLRLCWQKNSQGSLNLRSYLSTLLRFTLLYRCRKVTVVIAFILVSQTLKAAEVELELVDAINNEPIPSQKVTAYQQQNDGTWVHYKSLTGDENGQIVFSLDNIENGQAYLFKTKVFNDRYSYSEIISDLNQYRFAVGHFQVQLKDGNSEKQVSLTSHKLEIQRLNDEGQFRYYSSAVSDINGLVRLDLLNSNEGVVSGEFRLAAYTKQTGDKKYSSPFSVDTSDIEFVVGNLPLALSLNDASSDTPIIEHKVTIYEKLSDGKFQWTKSKNTDENGLCLFDLEGIDVETSENRTYVAVTTVFNEFRSYSSDIGSSGRFSFDLATSQIRILDGALAEPLPLVNHKVSLFTYDDNGKKVDKGSALSDAQGLIKLQLAGVSQQNAYYVSADNTSTQERRVSQKLTQEGMHDFVVGGRPLVIDVSDALSGDILKPETLDIYRVNNLGEKHWADNEKVDDKGRAIFDLPSLPEDEYYIVKARYFEHSFYSSALPKWGTYSFALGEIRLTLNDGHNQSHFPLIDKDVSFYKLHDDGSSSKVATLRSDINGQVRVNLAGIGEQQTYLVLAKSDIGSVIYQKELRTSGEHYLLVGSQPLNVTLRNTLTSNIYSNTKVKLYSVDDDMTRHYVSSAITNEFGNVSFDLPLLSQGKLYQVSTEATSSIRSYSSLISAAGDFDFYVGSVELKFRDGSQQKTVLMSNAEVSIYRLEKGKYHWFNRAMTDDSGVIKLDLPKLSQGTEYIASVQSVVSGEKKYTPVINRIGHHEFVIGSSGLRIHLFDALSEANMPEQTVELYRLDTQNKAHWISRAVSDNNGLAIFDLDPLPQGESYYAQTKAFSTDFKLSSLPLSGSVDFAIGRMSVAVVSGITSDNKQPLVGQKVYFYNLLEDGKEQWLAEAKTNEQGMLRVNVGDFSNLKQVFVKTRSSLTNTWYRQEIKAEGEHLFSVGSDPLLVSLKDGQLGHILAGHSVAIYQINTDGNDIYLTSQTSDEQGRLAFELEGLSKGLSYRLRAKSYSDFSAYSTPISKAGKFEFSVGKLQVQLNNGASEARASFSGTRVDIYKQVAGKKEWAGRATSDEHGLIRIDFNDVSVQVPYFVSVKSTIDGTRKYSAAITTNGFHSFVLGSPAVELSLNDYFSELPFTSIDVTAYQINEQGKGEWYRRVKTDEQGKVVFDLDGISEGRQYQFTAKVFNSGYARSQIISSPGFHDFKVGALEFTLKDRNSGSLLSNKRIYLYEITSDNRLQWRAKGDTSTSGVLSFDVEGLNEGRRFVVKALDVYGDAQSYYGPVFSKAGQFDFIVNEGEGLKLDLVEPSIEIVSPNKEIANSLGFKVGGLGLDNTGLSKVIVEVDDPIKGVHRIEASLDHSQQSEEGMPWFVDIPADWLSSGQVLSLTATAVDFALNQSSQSTEFLIQDDGEDPIITISSHSNGSEVNQTGFTIMGTVSDDIEIASFTASMPLAGIVNKAILLNAQSGQWALTITSGKVSVGDQLELLLTAINCY